MPIREAILPEFDHEMGTTRKTLERVPEANTIGSRTTNP